MNDRSTAQRLLPVMNNRELAAFVSGDPIPAEKAITLGKNPARVAAAKAIVARRRAQGLPVGGEGRKGVPNKMTSTLRAAVLDTFERLGGVDAMVEWAQANPASFFQNILKLIPKELSENERGVGIQVIVQGTAQLRDARGVTIDAVPE